MTMTMTYDEAVAAGWTFTGDNESRIERYGGDFRLTGGVMKARKQLGENIIERAAGPFARDVPGRPKPIEVLLNDITEWERLHAA